MTFGLLTVIRYAGNANNSYDSTWLCKCECGNEKVIRGSSLVHGSTKSCGCMTSRWLSEKISIVAKNRPKEKNPMLGKHHTEKAKQAISKKNKGRLSGSNNPAWLDGISFEPYCPLFNRDLKERVRSFFNYECAICGKSQYMDTRKLSVHHVEYNKQACCDGKPVHFAALCMTCHNKTNYDREKWESMLHRIIDEIYGGRSYYTKKEYEELTCI